VVHALGEIDVRDGVAGAFEPLDLHHAAVDQRQLYVLKGRQSRQQVEGLEDEPDFPVPDMRQIVVVHVADETPGDEILSRRRRVERSDHVHQRRLSRARWPHDGDVFAFLDLNADTRNGVDLLVAHDVGFPEIEGTDDDAVAA
jgi:hypothetical protein